MRFRKLKKTTKSALSALLAAVLLFSLVSGAVPTYSDASSAQVSCNVKFSKPAICCDVGQTVNLAGCGVQFAADAVMTKSGITWKQNGSVLTSFTPSARGVYALTATSGGKVRTVYIVAKNPEETEYVLYRNDFSTAPSDFRVVETSNGGSVSVSGGNYILRGAGHKDAYVRVLLPEYLDVFGDATFRASVKFTASVDNSKWAGLMYRVQSGNSLYYQACMRRDATTDKGIDISMRNAAGKWDTYKQSAFGYAYPSDYNLYSVTAKGTNSVFHINSYEALEYSATGYAAGAFGIQVRGAEVMVDFVEVTLDGNDPVNASCDVSFGKPAIRADMGDTIDLTACDVQFTANAIYTKGSAITWKKGIQTITSFTPTQAGVTVLTATSAGITKKIYVVTRNLTDSEYVLYYNNFDSAPSDFRVVQQTSSYIYHDGAGHYVIDASSTKDSYGRVLLPSFLDAFGDFKLETSYMDTNAVDARKWSALMAHVQNSNYPYIQFCIRNDASVADGTEISAKTEATQTSWTVYNKAAATGKISNAYNRYTLSLQNNQITGAINGATVVTYDEHPYVTGAMGFQARGLKMTIDYVKVTLGDTTTQKDTAVKCHVSKARPAIGCNAGPDHPSGSVLGTV